MINFRWIFILFLIEQVLNQELLPNDRCNHYPDRGTCETKFEVKWYYDRFDKRCRRFFYGGCDGNDNKFDSLEECKQTCRYEQNFADEDDPSKRCFLPHDPGTCSGNFERWHFDASIGQCVCSWWSGCGGNANSRYYSYQHCMHICNKYATNPDVNVGHVSSSSFEQHTPFRPEGSRLQVLQPQWQTNFEDYTPGEAFRSDEIDYPYSIDTNSNAENIFERKRRGKSFNEFYETPFRKIRKPTKKARRLKRAVRYEEYAETPAYLQPLNLRPVTTTTTSRKPTVRYEEYAETPFRWPNYVETTTNSRAPSSQTTSPRESPPRIPQEILNRLIQQYLAKRPQFVHDSTAPTTTTAIRPQTNNPSQDEHYTVYRRYPVNSSQLSYQEKRRKWKAEMKRRIKAAKVPPRLINPPVQPVEQEQQIPTKKGKYFITYSPYNRQYQISKQRPRILDDQTKNELPTRQSTITTRPILSAVSSTQKITTTRTPVTTKTKNQIITTPKSIYIPPPITTTTTTTAKPTAKIVRLQAESVPDSKGAQLTIRVASIKPTIPPPKQIINLDDYDVSEEEEDDDAEQARLDHYQQPPTPYASPTPPIYRQTLPPYTPQTPIYRPPYQPIQPPTQLPYQPNQLVYPVGSRPEEPSVNLNRPVVMPPITTPRTPIHKRIEEKTNFFAPPKASEEYDDLGGSEEDLFFWKPDYEQKKDFDRVRPHDHEGQPYNEEQDIHNDPYKIEVHDEAVRR